MLKNKKARELIAFLLCARGTPVKKSRIADTLWPDTPMENAMSSLYKIFRYLRGFSDNDLAIPIRESVGEVWLDMTGIFCDLTEFDRLYNDRGKIESCAALVEIYRAQLFFDECYDWVAPFEAYYDIRFFEITNLLVVHFTQKGDTAKANYYRSKIE